MSLLWFSMGVGVSSLVWFFLTKREVDRRYETRLLLWEVSRQAAKWVQTKDQDAADWNYVNTLRFLGYPQEAADTAALLTELALARTARAVRKGAAFSVIPGGKC